MNADALKFFSSAIFDIPKIDLGWCTSGPKIGLTYLFLGFQRAEDTRVKIIFRMPKIADEKLQGVSFHNHLVAR